jgi:predicted nuclease with RNAse H fold
MLVVGIDVGAPKKGFHAVALLGAQCEIMHCTEPAAAARWCAAKRAAAVAVDAPCAWAAAETRRAAEREMAAERVSCFSTPSREAARGNSFYDWMRAGERLYQALASDFPLWTGDPARADSAVSIETFPYAVACALNGARVPSGKKASRRRALLDAAGIDVSPLKNLDYLDAALCALTAQRFLSDAYRFYGDSEGGRLIVPTRSVTAFPV